MDKLFFCLLLCSSALGYSQDRSIKGLVVNAKTKQPIPYASIGIVEENVGTVSNEDGLFRLTIPTQFFSDSLTFSEVAHSRKKVSIASLLDRSEIVIELEENIIRLSDVEVTINKKKRKYENLGVKPMFYWGSCYANFKGGAQIAQLMGATSYPVFLSKARIKIGDNTLEKAKIRVRVLEKTANGLPGLDVFEGSFMDISYQKGWVEVDLSHANLILNEDFFVCFEFLNVLWQPTGGYFSIVCWETDTSLKKNQFVRNTSFGKWEHALPGQSHIYAVGAEVSNTK